MKNALLIICILIILAGGYYVFTIPEPEPEIQVETVFETETTYVELEPEVIIKQVEKLKYDTLVFKDTVYMTEVAEIDTSFKEGDLSVKYYYEPRLFDIEWRPKPLPVITNTEINTIYLPYNPKWYERPQTGFVAGALTTGILVWMVK